MNKQEQDRCDDQGLIGGISIKRNIKRSWHYCPRCMKRAVRKELRKCANCEGRLYWAGIDDFDPYDPIEDFYVWYRGLSMTGWFHRSFFRLN